ncbi:MAG: immunity 49 family protein [Gemmataceae bacterium]
MRVERHKINEPHIREIYEDRCERLPHLVRQARTDPDQLGLVIRAALQAAMCGSVVEPNVCEIVPYCQLAAQATGAVFAIKASPNQEISVRLGEEEILYQSEVHHSITTPGRWISGCLLSLIVRDTQTIDCLCRCDPGNLRVSKRSPKYERLLAEALYTHFGTSESAGALFLEVLKTANPEEYYLPNVDLTIHIDIPVTRLICFAITAEEDFGDVLLEAINDHKTYWERHGSPEDIDGLLAHWHLGAAALAHDLEVPFEIDSEYLPTPLIRGECL